MTVGDLIQFLNKHPQDMRVFGFNSVEQVVDYSVDDFCVTKLKRETYKDEIEEYEYFDYVYDDESKDFDLIGLVL